MTATPKPDGKVLVGNIIIRRIAKCVATGKHTNLKHCKECGL